MSRLPDLDELALIVHAMTGEWLSSAQAQQFAAAMDSREDLLAHGIVDLKWLAGHPGAARYFDQLTNAGRLPFDPLPGEDGPEPPRPETGLSRDAAMALLKQFAENATDADPLETLRAMSTKRLKG